MEIAIYISGAILTAMILLLLLALKAAFSGSKGNTSRVPDVLLILGCRVRGEEAEPILQSRIDAAAEYLSKNKGVLAIPCGGIVHEDQFKSEAAVIKKHLVSKGIEAERIILEDKSTTTKENFSNAKRILEEKGLKDKKIAFLSSEFHLYRSGLLAKIMGVEASSLPAPCPKNKKLGCFLREAALIIPTYFEYKRS